MDFMGEKTNRRELLVFRSAATDHCVAVIDLDPRALCRGHTMSQISYTVTFTLMYSVLQWEFHPCGSGFIIGSVYRSYLFLAVRDWKGLQSEEAAEVVTDTFPTCWEVELLNYGNESRDTEDGADDDERGDVYVR